MELIHLQCALALSLTTRYVLLERNIYVADQRVRFMKDTHVRVLSTVMQTVVLRVRVGYVCRHHQITFVANASQFG